MKNKLKDIIEKALDNGFSKHIPLTAEYLADRLVENSVTLSPSKKGKWQKTTQEYTEHFADGSCKIHALVQCSRCGFTDTEEDANNFCQNCGACMYGKESET